MKTEKEAIKKLTDPSKVSSNYYIKNSGEILTLVLIYTLPGIWYLKMEKLQIN